MQYHVCMSQIAVTVKIDSDLKKEAQELAKALGLSLSAVVENKLREVVRERRVVFEEAPVPNEKTQELFAEIEADVKNGKHLSDTFTSFDDLKKHLKSL